MIECQPPDFTPHGRLRELRNRIFGVFDSIRGLVSVVDAGVEHAVEFQGDVIGGDGGLGRDLHGGFFEGFDVGDAVEDGDQDLDSRGEGAVVFAHAFDDPGGLLGDEADNGVGREGLARGEVGCWGGGGVGAGGGASCGGGEVGCGLEGGMLGVGCGV